MRVLQLKRAHGSAARDEGAVAVIVSLLAVVLIGLAAFAVDLGKGRWDQGLPSTYNMPDRDSQFCDYWDVAKFDAVRFTGFQYQVRIKGALSALRFENTLQCNIGMLPTLLPGKNTITVEGESLPAGAVLKIEYAWMEGAETKTHVSTASALPHRSHATMNSQA